MGRIYYEVTLPGLVAAANRVAKELKETNRLLESTSKEIILTALTLPEHLRRSLSALFKLGGKGTADEVSKLTGKARANESAYLNQLETMGFIKRQKRGREVIFCLP